MARNWLFKRKAFLAAGGFDAGFADALELQLILRLINQGQFGFGHIPEPLVIDAIPCAHENEAERRALLQHLRERGYQQAVIGSPQPRHYQIDYGHQHQPLVSIVLVMPDKLSQVQHCIISLLEQTRHGRYELLIVDNACGNDEARHWLEAIEEMLAGRARVVSTVEAVSRSEAINLGAQQAKGEYLLLLRPEVAILNGEWLIELLNHAQRPEVGIVGAKAISKTREISHAGVILGLHGGGAGHAFLGEPMAAAGYMNRLQVDQNYSAVSDICLMIRKTVFEAVGGLDADAFAQDGADIDLCLRVGSLGYLTVWTPRAVLAYSEKRELIPDSAQDSFNQRWLTQLGRDPAYNLNFSLARAEAFKLADAQLSWRPVTWRALPTVLAHPADLYGCGHYRVIQPLNALREAGLVEGAVTRELLSVASLERYAPDTIILQRQLSEQRLTTISRIQRFSRAFKVYELDDYLPNLPVKNAHRTHMPKDVVRSLRKGLYYVDRFVVSTDMMAEAFKDFHQEIRVVENRLDPRWWADLPASRRRSGDKPRVGWAGGGSHTGDLELIADVVKALAEEVDWVFFGMCPPGLRPYIKEFHAPVNIQRYPLELAKLNLDLALAPVEENLFNQCKSNLRLLEYGICGFPVVCSDLICYRGDLPVTRVRNRFKDWVDAIRMHLADLDAAAQAGDALRDAVRCDWLLEGKNLALWHKAWLPD